MPSAQSTRPPASAALDLCPTSRTPCLSGRVGVHPRWRTRSARRGSLDRVRRAAVDTSAVLRWTNPIRSAPAPMRTPPLGSWSGWKYKLLKFLFGHPGLLIYEGAPGAAQSRTVTLRGRSPEESDPTYRQSCAPESAGEAASLARYPCCPETPLTGLSAAAEKHGE